MTLSRQLARLMAVVIVMIAASFAASVAQAHEGHAHHASPSMASQPVEAAPLVSVDAVALLATITVKAVTASPSDQLASAAMPRATGASDTGCHGVCCSMGGACCFSGIVADAESGLLPLTMPKRLVAASQARLSSLPPEALPKPPRSFA